MTESEFEMNTTRPTGQVGVTPEGGPIDEGAPAWQPGAGQVYATPEAGPLGEGEGEGLTPPTLRDHLQGPILGLDDAPAGRDRPETTMATASASASASMSESASPSPTTAPPAAGREEAAWFDDASSMPSSPPPVTRTAQDDEELKKWPPYTGKPVSDVQQALRYAAPVAAEAEKLAIRAVDLTGRGLTKLARFLEERRERRDADTPGDSDASR